MADVSVAVGWVNIAYISSAAALGYFVDYRLFVALTSWVHYCKYIHQYYFRAARGSMARYKAWQRDVLLYKTLALSNLAYIYAKPYYQAYTSGAPVELDYVSIAMIVVGYYIGTMAAKALGVDGTYFGIELGFVKAEYNFVKEFPYNIGLPHPMITGQVFGLLGLFKPAHVHSQWPWLVPLHVLLYFTHMFQEIYDFWDGEPWFKKKN